MYTTPENFFSASKVNVEAALAIAQAQFAVVEKLAALNLATAKAAFEEAADHMKASLEVRDPQELAKLNSSLAQPGLEKAVAYARSVYDVTSQAQANVAKVLEAHGAELNRTVASSIDGIARNAPAGSDAAINVVKSAFAAFNTAYDGMSKVAKQASEVVEVNFANAANATRAAAQPGGKRKAA